MNLNIVISKDEKTKNDAYKIRTLVFVEEQGFKDEFDDVDGYAYHIAAYDGDRVIGSGRFFSEHNDGEYHVGRIAVHPEYRGKNIGSAIMLEIEKLAKKIKAVSIVLSAQKRAMCFYTKLGYEAYGEEYLDEYCPHIAMKKIIE